MEKTDCLLIHTPKFNNYYKPLGEYVFINSMAMGLLGLADYLNRHGNRCRILHLGVEWLNNENWQLNDTLRRDEPTVIGLSLHWHFQSYDVMESCRIIRKKFKNAYIVLGGITASIFHKEILEDFEDIDGIICGDGEQPLLQLVESVKQKKTDLSNVPNLTWRNNNNEIICNKLTSVADENMLNELNFSNFDLLENYKTYIDYMKFPYIMLKGIPKQKVTQNMIPPRLFHLSVGRGCPFNCTWCGGSSVSQKRISARSGFIWRNQDSVMKDIRGALDYGYDGMYTVFDPTPNDQGYFIDLFKKIRSEGLGGKMRWLHEPSGLTSKEFVDAFAETFKPDFRTIMLSPNAGNETIRRKNVGYFFSNKDLISMIKYMNEKNVYTTNFFTYGFPGENEEMLKDTFDLQNRIKKLNKGKNAVYTNSLEMEAGAPWQMNPEKYGIISSRNTFRDFYNIHRESSDNALILKGGETLFTAYGYYNPKYFAKPLASDNPEAEFATRLQKIHCKNFCSFTSIALRKYIRNASPFFGRKMCLASTYLRKLSK